MSLVLYNTLTRKKEPFAPLHADRVGLYVCGPTVYDRIHIGNARPLIVFDVLFRLLKHLYPDRRVDYVRNITDVDDKIMDRAAERGIPIDQLTRETTAAFHADAAALGCLPPTVEPTATGHITEMLALIAKLVERGAAYAADGHVLFHVPALPAYGKLSGRDRDEQIAGARVEVAPYKRDPADFVLWKPSAPDQPGWDSPWGRGRPGWHIECSAMAERHLGVPFDIHGGGIDLIFPHHENEIAQSCAAHAIPTLAKVWMHNGFVTVNGEKMAKSAGNFTTVEDALANAPGEAIRLWTLRTHYRSPIDFTSDSARTAVQTLAGFYSRVRVARKLPDFDERLAAAPVLDEFDAAISDDLNSPGAIAALHGAMKSVGQADEPVGLRLDLLFSAIRSANLLGLLDDIEAFDQWYYAKSDSMKVEAEIKRREIARKERNFALADQIRNDLLGQGIVLEDGPVGTIWRRA